ncbi:MAG TPA: FAD:protein FMN transferase ApbE, partial [Serratia marcescens]|nr:FAD:protein FMN transferase ApbE [Serratia marcescens]
MRASAMKGWLTLVALGATLLLSGCGPAQVSLEGKTMGTSYSIRYLPGDDTPSASEIQTEIDKRLELVNDQMSTYRPDSELSRFNRSRAVDTPFPVSAATAQVVSEALRINRVTDG